MKYANKQMLKMRQILGFKTLAKVLESKFKLLKLASL